MSDPLDQIDTLLGDILSQGWDDPPAPAPEYPPLPTRDVALPEPPARKPRARKEPAALAIVAADEPALTQEDDTPPDTDQDEPHGLFDIGLLSDLATGRKGALEAAQAAGLTTAEVQSQLATALRDVDPTELAKALGMQAAEQQLKSGAIYGVVLSELVRDMMNGRMTAGAKIDLAKLLASVGKIMPKEDKTVGAGGGFVLNISMGASPAQPITIEAE